MKHRRSGSTRRPRHALFAALEEPATADVAVLGGGIVGITTALRLQETGAHVLLLEAGRLAGGVSGQSAAKVTSQHGLASRRRLLRAFTAPTPPGATARRTSAR